MSQQVPKPPQERGKQDYSEPGLGQTAPTQLLFFIFSPGMNGCQTQGPQSRAPRSAAHSGPPSRKVRSGGLSDHPAKRMRD